MAAGASHRGHHLTRAPGQDDEVPVPVVAEGEGLNRTALRADVASPMVPTFRTLRAAGVVRLASTQVA